MMAGLAILIVFVALVGWAAWAIYSESSDVTREEWFDEDDPRRTWRRI